MSKTVAVRDEKINYRRQVQTLDSERIGRLTQSTGFFTEAETEVARELIDEALAKGDAAGYLFVFAESQGEVVGYVCYGHIACTLHGYDIYWIVVSPAYQGLGLGRALLNQTEDLIRDSGGKHAYIETSARAQYLPTRGFYLRCGYEEIARLSEFYAPSDDKIIYRKTL